MKLNIIQLSQSQENAVLALKNNNRSFVRTDWNEFPCVYNFHGDLIHKISQEDFNFLVEQGLLLRLKKSHIYNLVNSSV